MKVKTKFNLGDIVYWIDDVDKWKKGKTCSTCGAQNEIKTSKKEISRGKIEAIVVYETLDDLIDISYEIKKYIDGGYSGYAITEIHEELLFASKKEIKKKN